MLAQTTYYGPSNGSQLYYFYWYLYATNKAYGIWATYPFAPSSNGGITAEFIVERAGGDAFTNRLLNYGQLSSIGNAVNGQSMATASPEWYIQNMVREDRPLTTVTAVDPASGAIGTQWNGCY